MAASEGSRKLADERRTALARGSKWSLSIPPTSSMVTSWMPLRSMIAFAIWLPVSPLAARMREYSW